MTSKNNQPGDAAPSADTTSSLQADSLRLSSGQALRRQAEEKLSKRKKKAAALPATESDPQRLIYELEVHQIELEMQNKELVQSRTQVEVGLRQYTDLYDFAPVGYFTLALDGAIHQVNMAGANLLGMEHGALIKRRFGVFVSVESLPAFSAFLKKVFSTSGSKETCEIVLQKDGSAPLWVHIEAMTEDGQRKTCRAVMVDITERKRAELQIKAALEKLRRSEENFRHSLEDLPLGVRVVAAKGETIYANKVILDIYGYANVEELSKIPLKQRYTPQSYAEFQIRKKAREDGDSGPSEYEINIVRKNGEIRHLQVLRKDVLWNGIKKFQVIYQDTTERKKAEEALWESEEQYRLVVENAKESIIIIIQDMKLAFVNRATMDMLGYSKEILISKSFTDFIHPDDLNMVDDHYIKRLKGEEVIPVYSFRVIGQDGTVIWCEINATVIQWKGKPATLNFLNNVTERKQADTKLLMTLENLRKSFGATIQVMVSAVEMRDPYTAGHQIRVANIACGIAKEMGLPNDKIEGIRMAGSIHDIGKLSIPAEILSKPTKLTEIEFSLIKEHSRSGYEMLKDVESPWPLAQIVYQHHERINGSGYPRNLKGDEIILEARIMAVADVVEAMASHRPYRAALGIDAALAEIEKNKGTHYDKTVADACLRLFRQKGYNLEGT
jgi:PAS domain S-box-containing protein